MEMNRRKIVGGLAAAGVMLGTRGAPLYAMPRPKHLFENTALERNQIASKFERLDTLLPDLPVLTATGPANLSRVGGKTRLLSLWAVWCVPCLIEIRDFGILRPQFADDNFDIGLLATASGAGFDRTKALDTLSGLGATGMPLIVEANGGGQAAAKLATPTGGKGFTLPCTLLVDAKGRVRGRLFGAPSASETKNSNSSTRKTTSESHVVLSGNNAVPISAVEKEILASSSTSWSGQDGLAFLKALKNGALDRV